MADVRCGTCKFLCREPGKKLVPGRLYECGLPTPELPKLPDSITKTYDFSGVKWPPEKRPVTIDRGKECPTWEKLTKPASVA